MRVSFEISSTEVLPPTIYTTEVRSSLSER